MSTGTGADGTVTRVTRVRAGARAWLNETRAALLRDGLAVVTGTGLEAAAAHTGAVMLEALDDLLPLEEDLTVYARGHLRHYPPTGPDSSVLDVLGSAALLKPVRHVLGPDCYIANYMGHTVLPGADAQPVHADWGPLWADLGVHHPPFLLAFNLALQDLDASTGAIEVWPGTHRPQDAFEPGRLTVSPSAVAERSRTDPSVRVTMVTGDLLLRDVRTWHRGSTNPAGTARPIVFGLVSAGWYRYRTSRSLLLATALRPRAEALGVEILCDYTDAVLDPVALSVGSPDD